MDKERSVDYWANEGGKRIEFVALANGDVRINFNTSDGRTYESLTLASYRYASVVEAIGKFHKGNTMNNKELTELKKEFEKIWINEHGYANFCCESFKHCHEDDMERVWDFFLPHLKSNDEIKREAVEEFLKSQIEYEAEEYAVCPLCKREFIWGETYCPDDRRKLITETRNKLEWSNRNAVIKELIESLTQKENNE